jgi:hypothetical protein
MVKYFFESEERQKKLEIILGEWVDTPFKHKCGVKGLGCDCVHFAIRVYEEFGLIDLSRVNLPDYPRDWHMHNTREALKEAIEKYLNVEIVDLNGTLMNGDIILAHYGNASSHAGIWYENHVFQAIDKIGVKSIHFEDKKFRKQMKYAYRIKA